MAHPVILIISKKTKQTEKIHHKTLDISETPNDIMLFMLERQISPPKGVCKYFSETCFFSPKKTSKFDLPLPVEKMDG